MTVYENMAFGLKLRKYPKQEIEERVREAAGILGIEEYLGRKPKALSGGQRQRVAVGRAIVRKPKVFLFDEPLSNLDAKLRVQMRTEISKLHQRLGATMIYVTHDQTEAMTMGDRIVLMKDGFVQQIASPLEIYAKPVNRFVAGFIGSPAMNFFSGKIEKRGRMSVFVEAHNGIALPLQKKDESRLNRFAGKELVFGLRPEHISYASKTPSQPAKAKAKVMVEVVEPMGNETYVYFTTRKEGQQHVARIPSAEQPTVGKSIELAFDMSQARYFDPATENVL
jgi:multiple sugar transport system ATP-binding protein